jgi:hypothetical protein
MIDQNKLFNKLLSFELMFNKNDYYSIIDNELKAISVTNNMHYDKLFQSFNKYVSSYISSLNIIYLKMGELTPTIRNFISILLWPIITKQKLNDKNYYSFKINYEYLVELHRSNINYFLEGEEYLMTHIKSFSFANNKLSHIELSSSCGVSYHYKNNRLKFVKFIDGTKILYK